MIEKKVISLIQKIAVSGSYEGEVTYEMNILDDLGFDSIQVMELVVSIEDEFDIEIEDYVLDIDVLSDISKLIDIVKKSTDNN